MSPNNLCLIAAMTILAALFPVAASGHFDPESRANVEAGYESRLTEAGPVGGYLFFLGNRPDHSRKNDLRVVAAPTFADVEYVTLGLPLRQVGLGIRACGGMFSENFSNVSHGVLHRDRSFYGGKAEAATILIYPRLEVGGVLPVQGETSLAWRYRFYSTAPATDDRFRLPPDGSALVMRTGIRAGGVPPELLPDEALEASLWFEVEKRFGGGAFGLTGQEEGLARLASRAWLRLGGFFPTEAGVVGAFLSAGTTANADPLGAYRLGGGLSLAAEFPRPLHGYALDEVVASRFWLLNLSWRFPLPATPVEVRPSLDLAGVRALSKYPVPHDDLLVGTGVDLIYRSGRDWTVGIGYGYAPWGGEGGAGGHTGRAFIEVNLRDNDRR